MTASQQSGPSTFPMLLGQWMPSPPWHAAFWGIKKKSLPRDEQLGGMAEVGAKIRSWTQDMGGILWCSENGKAGAWRPSWER